MMKAQMIDRRRPVLATVLLIIGLVLIVGGVILLLKGGSPYYLLSGLAVTGSAYLIWKGDRRGVWLYYAMLFGTLLWSLFESGLDPWGLQARLFAPAVLGLWVGWPHISLLSRKLRVAALVVVLLGVTVVLYNANRLDAADHDNPAIATSGRGDWPHYGNDLAGSRFSPLTQVTPANVSKLEKAWSFRTGFKGGIGFEATPIMVDNTLYLCSPDNTVFALDPETGAQRWRFNPKTDFPPSGTCRGVTHFKVPAVTGTCSQRILFGTADARLMAVDAITGKLCPDFGVGGIVDLREGMGDVRKGYYFVTSAPTIVAGNVIVGGQVIDGQTVDTPGGVIRGFDPVTGKLVWAFDPGHPDRNGLPPPGETYARGTSNSWGPISGDEALGLVYLPTGNGSPDYWGAKRLAGTEKYSSSVLAIDARTGALRWHFQTTHHDLWDYDVASQPTLIDLPIKGQMVPALIQPTKRGQIFLLDRRNGKPLAQVDERPVPQGAAAGDFLSPTQPFSTGMPAFDDTLLTERLMWGATPLDQLWCRIKFREARYEGPMTPPNMKPTITYPSYLGGIGWGGISIDPERRRMVVNWNRMANYTRMVPRAEADAMGVKLSTDGGVHVGQPVPQIGTPFALLTGAFLSPLGVPCTQPPFGKIGVVNLDTRKMVWQRPLGSSFDSGPFGLASHLPIPMGVPNNAGSMTTRSGLIFIGATQEKAIRAFSTETGKRLWSVRLPAGGHATPMTYISPKSGRQFVVIAAGGNATLHSGVSDYLVGFALPK